MHKIKLKIKENNTDQIREGLSKLNFQFKSVTENDKNIQIIFFSQYQIERFLNITNLQAYQIETFTENFPIENENRYKIGFFFRFCKSNLKFVNEKIKLYLDSCLSHEQKEEE